MKVTCSKCGASLTASADVAGKAVRCPKCKQTFEVGVVELSEDVAGTGSPAPTAQPPSSIPTGYAAPAQSQGPVLMAPQRRCACGYQGAMSKKWDSWVVPVAIVVAIFTMGLGLLFLLVPKKHRCPQCGSIFE